MSTNTNDPEFIRWMDRFDELAYQAGYEQSYTRHHTTPEDWIDTFESGESPESAFEEEMSAGADGAE